MKKLIFIALTLVFALALLCACAGDTTSTTAAVGTSAPLVTPGVTAQTTAPVTTAAATAAVTTKEPEETFVSPDLSLVDFDKEVDTSIKVYSNPLTPEFGIADPFVIRYDGEYYLYCSSGMNNDTKCYHSKDLVNWDGPISCYP